TLLAFATITQAFSTGSGTCNADKVTIEAVNNTPMGRQRDLGFEIAMSQTDHFYVPNGPALEFSISGTLTTFKGLLFYGEDVLNNHVGQWTIPSGYKLMANCPGDPKGTLTHSSATDKLVNTTSFQWNPPASDVGPITIVCVICVNTQTGFQIIRSSKPFVVNGSTFVPTPTPSNDNSTPAAKNAVATNSPHTISN
ncbi:3897_t:CDS:2, partial [Racocetra persica]